MTRKEILEAAQKCVCGDREQDYGSPEKSFMAIAKILPEDVAAMMCLFKIARIATGHGKADNWIDLAGYAACGGELEGEHGTTDNP